MTLVARYALEVHTLENVPDVALSSALLRSLPSWSGYLRETEENLGDLLPDGLYVKIREENASGSDRN